MSIFENFWGGSKKTEEVIENKNEKITIGALPAVESPQKKKSIQDVKEAVGDIQDLTSKRYDLLEKHRDTVEELRNLGVNDYSPDEVPRSDTVNEILNPIEEELAEISREITEKRQEFDLQPNREKVLKNRMFRLEKLKQRAENQFYKTPSGIKIKNLENQIDTLNNNVSRQQSEIMENIQKSKEEISNIYRNNKIANDFAKTEDRINRMLADTHSNLSDAKSTEYDENGFNRI